MIAAFLKELEEIAPLYNWIVMDHGGIRGRRKESLEPLYSNYYCPITAVSTEKINARKILFEALCESTWGQTAISSREEAEEIMNAADGELVALREKILKAVGL